MYAETGTLRLAGLIVIGTQLCRLPISVQKWLVSHAHETRRHILASCPRMKQSVTRDESRGPRTTRSSRLRRRIFSCSEKEEAQRTRSTAARFKHSSEERGAGG